MRFGNLVQRELETFGHDLMANDTGINLSWFVS